MRLKEWSCLIFLFPSLFAFAKSPSNSTRSHFPYPPSQHIVEELNWKFDPDNLCGGYFLDSGIQYQSDPGDDQALELTGNQGLFSEYTTSILQGDVKLVRQGQEISAERAYVYRNADNQELNAIDLVGNIKLHEPNTLFTAARGRYEIQSENRSLLDVLYRTALIGKNIAGAKADVNDSRQDRIIHLLTGWGHAEQFSQQKPRVYELEHASFSTCVPLNPTWEVRAKKIILNRNTGRGEAWHARLFIKGHPIAYFPYFNFPIDSRRKSGFLWPRMGSSSKWGANLSTPYYWNLAPNYDMTLTPTLMSKRGALFTDEFRYLTESSQGSIKASIIPLDQGFKDFQSSTLQKNTAQDTQEQAELTRLNQAHDTRYGFVWRNESQFNNNWSSNVDFNHVSDDYYLKDFGHGLNEVTQNQLLQDANIAYKNPFLKFNFHLQRYETLHPFGDVFTLNQYERMPEINLKLHASDFEHHLRYDLENSFNRFDLIQTPGYLIKQPIGERYHAQPAVSWFWYSSYFYFRPRAQLALTHYDLIRPDALATHHDTISRTVPIFDIASGWELARDTQWLHKSYSQTLEPQLYYAYIPYRNQDSIPTFDTISNTLTYDQLFLYNRFTSIDRIGDTNQIAYGLTSRLLDHETGLEKVRLSLGQILYFKNRRVNLCQDNDFACLAENQRRVSPISSLFSYAINAAWSVSADLAWDPAFTRTDSGHLALHYSPDPNRILNFGYSYLRNWNPFQTSQLDPELNKLYLTDISFAWPINPKWSAVGRWTEDWNSRHFQNLLYGIQYDTCCYAVQFIAGREFTGLSTSAHGDPNRLSYNAQFYVQFILKGLGAIESNNPDTALTSISGYNKPFAQGR